MLKYAYGEQKQLDWAFKTSYLFVEKEEEDLTQRIAFSPDNFNRIRIHGRSKVLYCKSQRI